MVGERAKKAVSGITGSPEHEVVTGYLIMIAEGSKDSGYSYITLAEFICGVKYEVFETVQTDEATGMPVGVFRNHRFLCPEYVGAIEREEALH